MGKTEKTEGTETHELINVDGVMRIPVNHGVHTIYLDIATFEKTAMAKFVKKLGTLRGSGRGIDHQTMTQATALAIGYFDVPLDQIYGEGDDKKTMLDFNNEMLGAIMRMRLRKEAEGNGA